MKKAILLISFSIVSAFSIINAQLDIIITPGYGIAHTKSNIYPIQESYSSYITYVKNNASEGEIITADPNFDRKQITDFLSFQIALAGEGGYMGISYMTNKFIQERNVMSSNNFGRRFRWENHSQEYLLDVGFGSKYIDVFLSFGVNYNRYRMTSYQVYPNGTLSLDNAFNFNGVFKTEDTGTSYGFGFKIKPLRFLAIDFRYIYANHKLPGEYKNIDIIDNQLYLSDLSFVRPPEIDEFPNDFNKPYTSDNGILPKFNRSYYTVSLILHFRTNE